MQFRRVPCQPPGGIFINVNTFAGLGGFLKFTVQVCFSSNGRLVGVSFVCHVESSSPAARAYQESYPYIHSKADLQPPQ